MSKVLAIFFALIAFRAMGANINITTRLGVKEGLSHRNSTSIFESQGQLFIGTVNGLGFYDGKKVSNLKSFEGLVVYGVFDECILTNKGLFTFSGELLMEGFYTDIKKGFLIDNRRGLV